MPPVDRAAAPALLWGDAILFDLDGVLVDSRGTVERSWRAWAARRRLDAEAVVALLHGRRAVDVVRLIAPHLDADAEVQILLARELADADGVLAAPGAARLLAALPPSSWAIVTSGTRAIATARLRRAQLPIPDVLVSADDVAAGKPHPEGYLRAAARLGARPERCIVVEDAEAGVAAGRAANMTVIGVTACAATLERAGATVWVRSLAGLRAAAPAPGAGVALAIEEAR